MSRHISQNAMRALLAQETEEVLLLCVTLTHSTFAKPYRLVYNNESIFRAAGEFEPFAFTLNLPTSSEDQTPQVSMTIDNVDPAILTAVRTLPPGERVALRMEAVLASSPDTVEIGPLDFRFLTVDYDTQKITGTLGLDDDLLNVTMPGTQYTPVNSPGVFA